MVMTPEEHDMVFAAVSHMPHVVAYSLINALLDTDPKLLRYGGGGLRDFTRIAMSPEGLWRDICASNRDHLLSTLKTFSASIERMITFCETSDWEGLEGEFRRARTARKHLE
jgi:prephenate dehydrogenase